MVDEVNVCEYVSNLHHQILIEMKILVDFFHM